MFKNLFTFILCILILTSGFAHLVNSDNTEIDNLSEKKSNLMKADDFKSSDVIITNEKSNSPYIIQQKSSSKFSNLKSSPVIITPDIDVSGDFNYTQSISIQGVLSAPGNPIDVWGGETVYLFINSSNTDIISQIGEFATNTTETNGYYQFDISFDRSWISKGSFNYTVYFYGVPSGLSEPACFRCEQLIDTGSFGVKDSVTVDFTVYPTVKNHVFSPTETYNASITVSNGLGDPVDPSSVNGLAVNFEETYINSTTIPIASNEQFHPVTNISSYTAKYGVLQKDNITLTATLLNYNNYAFDEYIFEAKDIVTISKVNITTDFTFALYVNITGIQAYDTMKNNPTTRFARSGQSINIRGELNESSGTISLNNYNFTITVNGAGGSYTISAVTDINGIFENTTTLLSNTVFPDPGLDNGNITISSVSDDPMDFGSDISRTKYLYLKANVSNTFTSVISYINGDSLNVNDQFSRFYFPGHSKTITLEGLINDDFGNPARGVNVTLQFNNKSRPNEVINHIFSNKIFSMFTNGSGGFKFSFILPTLNLLTGNVTMRIRVYAQMVWLNPSNTNSEVSSFRYFEAFNTTEMLMRTHFVGPSEEVTGTTNSYSLYNITFFNLYNGAQRSNFTITIRDHLGRAPIGVNVTLSGVFGGINLSPILLTVNSSNNGIFTLNFDEFTTTDISSIINLDGTIFKYNIAVASGHGLLASQLFSESYTIFGPDDSIPTLNNIQITGNDGTASDLEFFINVGNSAIDNIRNVTFNYRVFTQSSPSYDPSDFVGIPWIASHMTLNNLVNLQFNYTLKFADYGNGFWVEWYITVFDLAGHGINFSGLTNGGNLWTNFLPDYNPALANYSASFSHSASHGSISTPFSIQIGDGIVYDVENNFESTVIINGELVSADNFNITLIDDVTIQLAIPADASGYSIVVIYYRILIIDPDTGEIISLLIPYQNSTMTYAGLYQGSRELYQFILSSSAFTYFNIIDFYFNITDTIGNSIVTTSFINRILGSGSTGGIYIKDESAPPTSVSNFTQLKIDDGRSNSGNNITVYSDEFDVFYVVYNISDNIGGVGLWNITFYWYLNGELNETIFYVVEGIILETSQLVGLFFILNFTIPEEFLQPGNYISWEVTVEDHAGNLITLNSQGSSNPLRFNVEERPPVVIVTDPGIDAEEETSNALWIVLLFLLVLGSLTLYYQRHNIGEILARRQRARKVQGTISELMEEIRRLGADGKFRIAILLAWEALERVCREIMSIQRHPNQTAREYAFYLSERTMVDRDTLLSLAKSFEGAKYGKDLPNQDDLDDTVKALDISVRMIIQSGYRFNLEDEEEGW
ncbi:MAG: DUF4129 domain-containing protein [Candidatus Heimdallarchaeota archaeon]|nr:DUF4129 domain-containing protein [Candidatus Heimdallarchaeota archaeon]